MKPVDVNYLWNCVKSSVHFYRLCWFSFALWENWLWTHSVLNSYPHSVCELFFFFICTGLENRIRILTVLGMDFIRYVFKSSCYRLIIFQSFLLWWKTALNVKNCLVQTWAYVLGSYSSVKVDENYLRLKSFYIADARWMEFLEPRYTWLIGF